MYEEKQRYQNRWVRWLQGICGLVAVSQAAVFVGTEAGFAWQRFDSGIHFGILVLATFGLCLSGAAGLSLQAAPDGLNLRFFPYQWSYRHIHWDEVRRIRILSNNELPGTARFGRPGHDFTHIYLLTNPKNPVLNITLVNGTQLFLSTEHPRELLDYLQHGVVRLGKSIVG